MSKITITGDLKPVTVSGAMNTLILDPEGETPDVYLFSCVGAAYPMPVAHGRHIILANVKAETVPESLREFIEDHAVEICGIASKYEGTEWDGHNHRGRWAFNGDELHDYDMLEQAYDNGTIATYWAAGDWFSPVVNELRTELATEDLDTIVEREIEQGLYSGAHLNEDDVRAFLENLREEIPQVPAEVMQGRWSVPPECQGQIVEVSYACDEEHGYRRCSDRSDRTETYARIELDVDDDWEPWNREPDIAGVWERCRV